MSESTQFLSPEQLTEVFSLSKTATAIHVGEDATIQFADDVMLAIWGKGKEVIGKSWLMRFQKLKVNHSAKCSQGFGEKESPFLVLICRGFSS